MEIDFTTPLSKAIKGLAERRFTIFTAAIVEDGRDLFQAFFGVAPEVESVQKPLFRREFAIVGGGVKRSLIVSGTRLDLVIGMDSGLQFGGPSMQNLMIQNAGGPAEPPEFLVIPLSSESALAPFLKSEEILDQVAGIKRMAVSESVFTHAASKEAAYGIFQEKLPFLHLDENCSDLYFRINRARKVKIAQEIVPVNRIYDWTAPSLVIPFPAFDDPTVVTFSVCVKTDINTAPGFDLRTMKSAQIAAIARMLFEFSAEIVERGDAP